MQLDVSRPTLASMSTTPSNHDTDKVLNQWARTYSEDLFHVALGLTQKAKPSKDLVQTTFLAAHIGFDGHRQDSKPKTWLISILNRKILDHYRELYANHPVNPWTKIGLLLNCRAGTSRQLSNGSMRTHVTMAPSGLHLLTSNRQRISSASILSPLTPTP